MKGKKLPFFPFPAASNLAGHLYAPAEDISGSILSSADPTGNEAAYAISACRSSGVS
jgi:hypothetical protein